MTKKKLEYLIDSDDMFFILAAIRSAAMNDVEYMRKICLKMIAEGEEDWQKCIECYTNTTESYKGIHDRLANQWKRHSGGERREQIEYMKEIFGNVRDTLNDYKEEIEKAARERDGQDII